MKEKRYITISEFEDVFMIRGEIPEDVISAANDGLYDIIDITTPNKPTRYGEDGWSAIEDLPNYAEIT
jgi:hypothetical protein|tara:strand:+ start:1171 stop:1374 length:204 start_codon:yes stop_codon:yes gene_type:complete